MRVFVAWATGVLGRRVVRQLVARGHVAIGLTRSESGDATVRSIGGEPRRADLFDADALARAAEGCSVVIHAATAIPTKVRTRPKDWDMNDRIRREGTRALTTAAGRVGAGAYLQQSVVWAVRGLEGALFDEDAPPAGDPILASALEGERIARDAGAKHGFRAAILRCGGFYSADGWHTRILAESLFRGRPVLVDVQCAIPFRFPVDCVVSHLRERPRRGGRRMAVRRIPREAGATDTRRLTALFIALVFAHLLVVLVHTVAHLELQIVPPPTDTVFILGVILIGPVAALPILRFNRPLASGLLIVVMAAAFAYGSQSHFVIPGPDQVSIVPSNPWTVAFVVTAIGIGILELLAVVVAVSMFGRSLRNPSGSPAR